MIRNAVPGGNVLRIVVGITALLMAGGAGATMLASDGITKPTENVSISDVTSVATNPIGYVEGINDNQPVDPNYTTDPMKESTFLYQPSKSYDLKRIEWYTYSGYGNFTIRLREDINGTPRGILKEVTFQLSGANGFQGADFVTSCPVTAGNRYWVGFYTEQPTGSHFASSGNIIEEFADWDLDGIWDVGPISWLRPMIKFYRETEGMPGIASFAPSSPVSDIVGAKRTFNITINQTVNVTWYINGTLVQTNNSVTSASYTNRSAKLGSWNITAIAQNVNGTAMQRWDWVVVRIRLPLLVSAKPMAVKVSNPVNITFKVTSMGKPVDNATINLSGAGITANAITNSTGFAVVRVHPLSKGLIRVTASKVPFSNGTGMVIAT